MDNFSSHSDSRAPCHHSVGFIRSPLVVKWLRSLAAKLPEAKAALELHSA